MAFFRFSRAFSRWPTISGDIVVWQDERNAIIENRDIYGAKLSFEEWMKAEQ